MKNMTDLHAGHNELNSEITFLKQEIKFLLKMLSKSYSSSVDRNRIKLLDSYWKEFEKCGELLEAVTKRIRNCEIQLHTSFERNGKASCQDDTECSLSLNQVKLALRSLKENFYDFMIESNYKTHETA